MFSVTLAFTEEKKHSVRYDAVAEKAGITAVYIMKTHLSKPYPRRLEVEVKDAK